MPLRSSQSFISFVVPAFNEEGNLEALYQELVEVSKDLKLNYEVWFINDGSRDQTQAVIEKLFEKDPQHVNGLQFRNHVGKAAGLHAGFRHARGNIIVTLDADLQDDPHELPKLLDKLNDNYDLVSGWKQHRQDSFVKNNTSKFFNLVTNRISHTRLHDYNCGFKAYRAEVAKGLDLYGELHRYIPVIVASQGYLVTEVPVEHRPRLTGHSKYGGLRFIHGALDLLTIVFITRFRTRPLHLFGYLGLSLLSLGFLGGLYLTYLKIFLHQAIGGRPALLLTVLLIITGVQIGVTGLVGEQLTSLIQHRIPGYKIKKILTYDHQ